MAAFPISPVTLTTNYLRKTAMNLDLNPVLRISMADIIFMNDHGLPGTPASEPKLRCLDGDRTCPCDAVKEQGVCDQGVFKR